jgi:hypothetical protein
MEREMTLPGQIHVACDTTIVRQVLHNKSPWLDDFAKMAGNNLVFSLADHTFAEIINQLDDCRLDASKYSIAIQQCTRFISREVPFIPGKAQLIDWCKTHPDENEIKKDIIYRKSVWERLLKSASFDEFKKAVQYGEGKAAAELEEERHKWPIDLDSPPQNWKSCDPIKKRLGALAEGLNSDAECSPHLVVRLDAALRHYDQLLLKMKGGMNPNSPKRRNDGIDYNMAFVFAKRILLCTHDGTGSKPGYYKAIKSLNSFQSKWVFHPQELVDRWNEGKLLQPTWPEGA